MGQCSDNLGEQLLASIHARRARTAVIGLGYVGLPLAIAASRARFPVIGLDIDPKKPEMLLAGHSYIDAVKSDELRSLVTTQRFTATTDMAELSTCQVIIICVPTPLTRYREPDMSYIEETCRTIATRLRKGQLIVLESTTYPGTTIEMVRPILETSGLTCGRDFFLGFSPEREDPGNRDYETVTIPKVVAGVGSEAAQLMEAFYGAVVKRVVPVSSTSTAEAVKITENVFRAVNIALVNELKVVYDAMGIDIWEIIEAAKTKPFGYMPFYPGPGLGGHCIPIDPFYLTWKSREFEVPTRFIELAGEINTSMPRYIVKRLEEGLDAHSGIALGQAKILLVGLAYKRNVSDIRESPSLKIMELIERRGSLCHYHDPHVVTIPPTREHAAFANRTSVALEADAIAAYDAVVVLTDHDAVDYALLREGARLIIDTRNVFSRMELAGSNIIKA